MVVVLLHNQVGGIDIVHPARHIGDVAVGALAGDGVAQHRALDVSAAEQADGLDHPGGNPPGVPLLIDLKLGGVKDVGGVLEAQVAHDVAVERLGEGVLHALGQADHLGLLGDHVHQDVGGQSLTPVGKPFDQVGIGNGRHPDGAALVVDLGGVVGVLKLADHIAEHAHLPVPQKFRAVPVQRGDIAERYLRDVLGKVAVLHRQQVPVVGGPEDRQGDDLADKGHSQHQQEQNAHRQAAALDKAQPAFQFIAGGTGGAAQRRAGQNKDADHVYHAQQPQKAVKLAGLEVQGRQRHVEIEEPHHSGDEEAEQSPAQHTGRPWAVPLRIVRIQSNSPFRQNAAKYFP